MPAWQVLMVITICPSGCPSASCVSKARHAVSSCWLPNKRRVAHALRARRRGVGAAVFLQSPYVGGGPSRWRPLILHQGPRPSQDVSRLRDLASYPMDHSGIGNPVAVRLSLAFPGRILVASKFTFQRTSIGAKKKNKKRGSIDRVKKKCVTTRA